MTDAPIRRRTQSGSVEAPGPAGGSPDSELAALARDYGIESDFTDAHGIVRTTTPATNRALLAAMNVRAETLADVRAARAAHAAQRWERALPPVVVAPASAVEFDVLVPADVTEIHGRVELEAGSHLRLRCDATALPVLEAATHDGHALVRRRLRLENELPVGYHRFTLDPNGQSTPLIVTPEACWLPPAVQAGERLCGIAVQLYLLRSATDWGIGDFSDLRTIAELVCSRGADVVGLNPLHQMFADIPEHASPYSPASRLLLNILNIDVTALEEYTSNAVKSHCADAGFQAMLATCRDSRLVDYTTVARLKIETLRVAFGEFCSSASHGRKAAFEHYRAGVTPDLERTFIFTALREHFATESPGRAAWQHWPAEYRDPRSPAVARFAQEHAAAVTFAGWLQWIADAQLEAAAVAGGAMRVGIYRDLAVGADPAGAETWSNARAVVAAARVGAPPDIYNPDGQNWGLPPFDPHALREEGYASFINLIRANMRHAGGLRIDHVMALKRLYWIPQGAAPPDGAYVRYPLDELVGIIALESHRARCLVVGEDLGTVPAGFRERMERANILSYRVLFFERDEDRRFIAPQAYPRLALAVLGSHDLPTLRAWWAGADIALRERLHLSDDTAAAELRAARTHDRAAFAHALTQADLLNPEVDAVVDERAREFDDPALFVAAHAFMAHTSSALAVAQLDDITAETDPVNVPTTSNEHPNWRRRMSRTLEQLAQDDRLRAYFDVCAQTGRLRTDDARDGRSTATDGT